MPWHAERGLAAAPVAPGCDEEPTSANASTTNRADEAPDAGRDDDRHQSPLLPVMLTDGVGDRARPERSRWSMGPVAAGFTGSQRPDAARSSGHWGLSAAAPAIKPAAAEPTPCAHSGTGRGRSGYPSGPAAPATPPRGWHRRWEAKRPGAKKAPARGEAYPAAAVRRPAPRPPSWAARRRGQGSSTPEGRARHRGEAAPAESGGFSRTLHRLAAPRGRGSTRQGSGIAAGAVIRCEFDGTRPEPGAVLRSQRLNRT